MRYAINPGAKVISEVAEALSANKESRFGLFLYNDEDSKSDWIFRLNEGLTTEEIQDKLLELGWRYQYGEDPSLAINTAVKELSDQKKPGVPRNVVLLTDGELDKNNEEETQRVSKKALCDGFNLFVISIETEKTNIKSLSLITGQKGRDFNADSTNELIKTLCKLRKPADIFKQNCTLGG